MEPRPIEDLLPTEMICAAPPSQHMHPDDLELLKQIITWRVEPEFPLFGRSAWVRLTHPFESSSGKDPLIIKSLKVKGVGLRDHRGATHHPSNETYWRPDGHLGIDDNGTFRELWSAPAPMGGLTLSRAFVEYATGNALCATGPISEVPLFLHRYSGMAGFRDDSGAVSDLGVIVAGLPTESPTRADCLVHYRTQQDPAVQETLRGWLRDRTGDPEFDWAKGQLVLWSGYGKRLREFHNCGFYRHNAHPCNLGLGPRGVFLVDLDSTRHLLECSPGLRALQTLRDAAGAIFHIVDETIRSAELDSAKSVKAHVDAVIDAFLSAYFPDVPSQTFEGTRAAAAAISTELWDTWSRRVDRATGDAEDLAEHEYREFMTKRHSQRGRGVDGPALFSRLMPGLVTPYSQSRVAFQGGTLSAHEVGKATEAFLRQRQAGPAAQ